MNSVQLSVKKQRTKYVVVDWITTSIAFFVFNIVRFFILYGNDASFQSLLDFLGAHKLMLEQLIIPIALLGLYWLSGYYNRPFERSRLQELMTSLGSALVNSILIYLALLTNDQIVHRSTNWELILILAGVLFIFTYIGRLTITSRTINQFKRNNWKINTLVIGCSNTAETFTKSLTGSKPELGYNVVGYIPIAGETMSPNLTKIFSFDDIGNLAASHQIDQFIISPESRNDRVVLRLLNKLFHYNLPIRIAPEDIQFITSSIHLQDIFGEPLVDLTSPSISGMSKNVKRVIDVIVSLSALILLSPLYAALAIAIKYDSKGPVFYRQERIGLHQKPFNIIKFRSMRTDAEADGPQLTSADDNRITRIGRILRKYRLDEIPQFWNVLIGDMSLVGPRPERRVFIDQIVEKAPYYSIIHQVRPGITSWGMVKFGYASTVDQMIERLRYDLVYLSNMSTSVDLKILIYTVKTVITGRGQ